ncbi:MAG: tRNA glutamyl-Q(34) synthetase GluQRS [Pseudomonadota bacterium]
MTFRTRFAPSPTGLLHLGHAFSAIRAHDMARDAGGTFLLRIEDIDQSRARAEWEHAIYDDLSWLGLTWETPVMRQSERGDAYAQALDALWRRGVLYPCTCSRRDILEAANAPQEGSAPIGPDGVIYPGTCRQNVDSSLCRPDDCTLRLNMKKAAQTIDFEEVGDSAAGTHAASAEGLAQSVGDVVVARRDMATSYHLAVVVDDAAQDVTHVVRGEDLFDATKIHVLLQRLLDLPTPKYHHHRLIRDDAGKRLAKRDDARAIAKYRADGATPGDIRRMVGL